ncbi:5-formyltetrahydrofolate cyclo-ligase [Salinisphaera orenii MK-B5]|uniref:5-formyltetrahydrofolate cyclo-ligase n=1 Tax=Salinisphaera orenii MK-B5 TaxID=856730 RepID=A0A423PUF0_9GAMM|nr:5-formyltetrahydrofolate cyclo-ligase [Salinisphaera orenii]ROO29194.1 5-formyltetrahydrofolate cyclo-ligase [Salinisphaera orenii MK-B5]
MSDITALRKRALAARRALSDRERDDFSVRAARRAARLPALRRARRIGFFWPMAGEIDPRPLIARLGPGCTAFLPRVEGRALSFVAVKSAAFRFRTSSFGLVEPIGGPVRPVNALDAIITPLAAFDGHARRIGMGGGFYDRTLALPEGLGGFRRPYLVGLAFEAQRVPHIETRPWDIDLDVLVTESAIHRRAQRAGESR